MRIVIICLLMHVLVGRLESAEPFSGHALSEYGKGAVVYFPGSGMLTKGNVLYMTFNSISYQEKRVLAVIDISQPTEPSLISTVSLGGIPQDLAISGDYLYVVNGAQLLILDISNPRAPKLVKELLIGWPPIEGPQGLDVLNNHVYLACCRAGVKVVEISDPSQPKIIGSCSTPGFARDITVAGEYAYVADDTKGMTVVHIKDPSTPRVVANFATDNGTTSRIWIDGNHAYLADGKGAVKIVDVTNPLRPILVSRCDRRAAEFYGVYSHDLRLAHVQVHEGQRSHKRLYVTDGEGGVLIVDVTDAKAPRLMGAHNGCVSMGGAYEMRSLAVKGAFVYANDEAFGLRVVDVSDPERPTLAGKGVKLSQ